MDKFAALRHLPLMPLTIPADAPTMLIRKSAFERAGLVRSQLDARYNLTDAEFRVEGELIAIGPLHDPNAFGDLTEQLEALGLAYFDDFFELSGNWPTWCQVYVREA
ncbi:MAG TPA: hypothetical protein VN677_00290 [Gemmatimonadaceae bacterium]|nr:hypothetical protein [Gemmatimonadaceae bacterium]